MDFYDLKVNTSQGSELNMSDFKGKTVLIVNTATKCALTPQFEGLEALHQSYKDKGLVVLGFPCNQFNGQEPLTNEDMAESCQINHGVTFQLTEKVEVNGKDTHEVYQFLKTSLGGFLTSNIKWNFTKFLISPEGEPLERYAPITKPDKIEKDIIKILGL